MRVSLHVLLLLLLLALAQISSGRTEGGMPVTKYQLENFFPFVVSVKACSGGKCKECVGTLVSPHVVLTAAHCMCDSDEYVKVYFLSQNRTGEHLVKGIYVNLHRNFFCEYNGEQNYDIAVIRLFDSWTKSPPVKLDCKTPRFGNNVYHLGYGGTGNLKLSSMRVVRSSATEKCGMTGFPFMEEEMFCAVTRRTNAAEGYSGGPVLLSKAGEYVLVGIVSGEVYGETKDRLTDYNEPQCTRKFAYISIAPFC